MLPVTKKPHLKNVVDKANINLDYDYPVKIADGIYWIGFDDEGSDLRCNPYLIVDGAEAVVIDGGSRPDFPVVMIKILRAGVDPSSISALIYDHFDPDLVGSVNNFENIINRPDLMIISDEASSMFIRHYYTQTPITSLKDLNYKYSFSSGRELQFINTPYAHSHSSFVTFDPLTAILFSGDIFGSLGAQWDLFLRLDDACFTCADFSKCELGRPSCPLSDIIAFNQKIMTSEKALRLAIEKMMLFPVAMIAPQHGSIIYEKKDIKFISEMLASLKGVGIDSY